MGSHKDKTDKEARKAEKRARKEAKKLAKEANGAKVEKSKSKDKAARKLEKELKKGLQSAESTKPSESSNSNAVGSTGSTISAGSAGSASSEAVAQFMKDNAVKIECSQAPLTPFLAMSEVPLTSKLASKLTRYSKPTPIQSATWPYLLDGRDVVGVAETGSGKTMAFGVPACQRISTEGWKGINVLVISPTRELAMQIYENLEVLDAESVCVYGGVPKYEQQKLLRKSPSIVVGTPGRLKDLIADGSLPLSNIKYLVLDEADRMLEKGFEEDIKEIVGGCPAKTERQTVMFTATWPVEVRNLASTFMKDGGQVVKVSIGDADELAANKRITQIVEVIDPRRKEQRFLDLLRKYSPNHQKVLVFALYKKEATRIENLLRRNGYSVAAIHGDLNQTQRTEALAAFKSGQSNLMLATDVAARGLDIPAVKVVINLTFPLTVADYVHRIGRTGRAGQTGTAYTLFTEQEKHLAGELMNVLRGANQPVPDELLKFGSHTKKKEHSLYGAFFKDVDPSAKAKKIKFD